MKFIVAILFLLSTAFTGCYTVLWTPDQDFPTESSYYSGGSGSIDGYYSDPYYGGYEYYYEYPWWLSMAPPSRSGTNDITGHNQTGRTERSEDIRRERNNDSGRNEENPRMTSPTRSSGSDSSGSTGQTSSTTSETKRNDNSNSGSRSENRNETRNSGERNSGSGRR